MTLPSIRILREALGRFESEVTALHGRDRPVRVVSAVQPDMVADDDRGRVGLRLQERGFRLPLLQCTLQVERALPGGRDGAVRAVAADQQHAVGCRHAGRSRTRLGQDQLLGRGLPLGQRTGLRVGRQGVDGRRRRAVRVEAAKHVDRARHLDDARVGAWLRECRALGPGIEVADARERCDVDGRLRGRPIRPADVQDLGPELDRRAVGPRGRQGQLRRRFVPRSQCADRRRAGQALVLGRAQVDRGPGQDAQLHGPVDGQVVRAIRDVSQHQDDDDQPDEGLDPGPPPAVRIEQAEQGPLARHHHPGSERPLRHRPPSSSGDRSIRSSGRSFRGQGSRHVGVHRAGERV